MAASRTRFGQANLTRVALPGEGELAQKTPDCNPPAPNSSHAHPAQPPTLPPPPPCPPTHPAQPPTLPSHPPATRWACNSSYAPGSPAGGVAPPLLGTRRAPEIRRVPGVRPSAAHDTGHREMTRPTRLGQYRQPPEQRL